MLIDIPNDTTFHVPQGQHTARCEEFKEVEGKDKSGNPEKKWRLVFEVFPLKAEPGMSYRAGKNYECSVLKGAELRQDLETWQGPGFIKRGQKFDSEALRGKEAIIEIVHVPSTKHPFPFCNITKILPPVQPGPADRVAEPRAKHDVGL